MDRRLRAAFSTRSRMTTVSVDQIRRRLAGIEERRRYFEWKSIQQNRLQRQEMWRHAYLARPYLIGAPDERVGERFRHIFMNAMELNAEGKIGLVPITETDEFMQLFTHILEEYGSRVGGHPPSDLIQSARAPFHKYFESGPPIGVAMFEGYKAPQAPIVVKYGKREFLERMFRTGELRLANAGLYAHAGFLESVRDDETHRVFFVPTYKERLTGQSHIIFQGHRLEFGDDDIVMPIEVEDYFLFSLCEHIHYRMPTDFGADAALVIRDPARFIQCLISTFLARFDGWARMAGKVAYYDPYRVPSVFPRRPEMAKHFGYAYQKEIRVAFRPRQRVSSNLEPLSLSIGSMIDYADLIYA
ncbi:MAG TPA: hypothetical protein VG407_07005 [Caulobacteraceae bacterium]|jgi:hypothetical protein|nr:hypothetical protein [Caulobacteraceae bacterium]